jgi:hypothetical protein
VYGNSLFYNYAVDFSFVGMATHYEIGERKDMTIKASTIDFSRTNQRELGLAGSSKGNVNLFKAGININSLAFGNIYLRRISETEFTIDDNLFDFDYQKNASFSRNTGTFIGGLMFGRIFNLAPPLLKDSMPLRANYVHGGPYNVIFLGTVTIPR